MKETFVFVHGAWLGAWCWDKVIPLLEEKGHKGIALDLPGHGDNKADIKEQNIHTYSAYIADVLKQQEEPVILVAHSMGGMSASEAAAAVPEKVKKIVYLTAFLPKDGQSNNYYGDMTNGIQETDWYALGKANIGVVLSEDSRSMFLEPGFAMPALYNDISEEEGLECCKFHGWEAVEAAYTPAFLNEAFDKIPKYYIKCSQDGILTPDIQEKMLAATPVEKIYTIDSGHCPYISKPQDVADILLDVAEA